MKMPALLAAAVALSACSTATPVDQSAGNTTPLTAIEAIDIAEGSSTSPKRIEAAKALVRSNNSAAQSKEVAASVSSGDAVCRHGAVGETRSFVICENGALRKASVLAALSTPHDATLKLDSVAQSYGVPPQAFIGIQSATYGSLVNGNRQAPRNNGKPKAQTGLVQIEGKLYEVYQVSSAGKTGTIFVEQQSDN